MPGDILWHSFSLVSLVTPPCVTHCQLQPPSCNLILKFIGKGLLVGQSVLPKTPRVEWQGGLTGAFCQGEALQSLSQEARFHMQGVV